MDADRFDRLVRAVSVAPTRRGALRALAGIVLGWASVGRSPAAAQGIVCSDNYPCPRGLVCTDFGDGIGTCECHELSDCAGCCSGDGLACLPGVDVDACGSGGETCDFCLLGRCKNRRCCLNNGVPCGGDTPCCNGRCVRLRSGVQECCAESQVCEVRGRTFCCEPGQRCVANRGCDCDEDACARVKGCCKGTRCVAGTEPEACGNDGRQCKKCPAGLDCLNGECRCTRGLNNRCAGCCAKDKSACNRGTAATACGNHGETCQDCTRKGAGWTCKDRRCCRQRGACPSTCPRDGACPQCCSGRCGGGQCGGEPSCDGIDCAPPKLCCLGNPSGPRCCEADRACCNGECVDKLDNCAGCGLPCNANGQTADRCVDGQCRCGDGPPCDCAKGASCRDGQCRCLASPGFKVCNASFDGVSCVVSSVASFGECPGGTAPLCTCTAGDQSGFCTTPV